ncbi:unnamed protein product, partial [marine sediment metagenome]
NPEMTAAGLRQVLRDSTDKIGEVEYTAGFNPFYGYGRLNAARALAASPDAVVVTSTNGSNSVAEGGPGKTYRVVLSSQPTGNVKIHLNPDVQLTAVGDADPNKAFLQFTPANWNVPQLVRFAAVNDPVLEDLVHRGTIHHLATSSDETFDGVAIADLSVQIADNDAVTSASVGDRVWRDLDGDGIQDIGEPGVFRLEVELFYCGQDGAYGGGDDVSAGTRLTDTDGNYGFEDLTPGSYYLQFPT